MQVGRKFRIYPDENQAPVLGRWIGSQRFTYNAKIEKYGYENWLRQHAILSPSWAGADPSQDKIFDQGYSDFRKTNPWMKEIPAEIFRNGCYRYRRAVINCAQGAGIPQPKSRDGTQSVLLTKELFQIEEQDGKKRLRIQSRKTDLGIIEWVPHREFKSPNMASISHDPDDRWFIGFSSDNRESAPKVQNPEEESEILGNDIGIANAIFSSNGSRIHPSEEAEHTYKKRECQAKHLQRKMARQKRGSNNRKKTKKRLARVRSKQANSRRDFAHKASFKLCQTPHKGVAFENIRITNLTARPKPRPNEEGTGYERNGARAKAGLNKSLLNRSLGLVRSLTEAKASKFGKLFILVPAAYSSQECRRCHFTSPANRPAQAEFICQACGNTDHADHNSSHIIAQRALTLIRQELPDSACRGGRRPPMTQEAPPIRKG